MLYTVQPGDTLARIARKFGTTVDAIRRANPRLRDVNRIQPRQRLEVPASPGESAFPTTGGGVNVLPPPTAAVDAGAEAGADATAHEAGHAAGHEAGHETAEGAPLAWGARVSEAFRGKVRGIARELGCDPSHLMAAMAFESGETFSPAVRNVAGSGATGLIQFMPATATLLGTTTAALAAMTAERQLDYVARYFEPYKGRMTTLEDVYMAILYPAAIGKPDGHVLFSAPSRAYQQNRGLDADRDGRVTKAEAAAKVRAKLEKGLRASHVG